MIQPSTEPQSTGRRIAEVVESFSNGFTAHCYRLYEAPPLGALVRTGGDQPVFAVVRGITTLPMNPARRPVARAQNEEEEEEVYSNNPQLPHLLRTDFQATIVGHEANGALQKRLPPHPPRIHAFIYNCSSEEILSFSQDLNFFPLLFSEGGPLTDEVVSAFLRQASSLHSDPEAFLAAAGRQLARLFARDTRRLDALLRSLRP